MKKIKNEEIFWRYVIWVKKKKQWGEGNFSTCESLLRTCGTKEGEGEWEICKLARAREKKSRGFGNIKCKKCKDNRISFTIYIMVSLLEE